MQDDIDMEPLHKLFIYRKKLVKPYIERLLKWMDGITYMMSALFILTLVYEHGFLISFEEMEMINTLYHFVWIVFLVDISLHLLLNYSDTKRKYRGLAWILSLMLYLTLIPVIFHEPEVQGGIHDFWSFFHSRLYHVVLLTLLSLLQLSNGIVRLLGRRTNPSLIFASSFLIFILIGAALLMLPRATYHGISFIDALFTATSAISCSIFGLRLFLCHLSGISRSCDGSCHVFLSGYSRSIQCRLSEDVPIPIYSGSPPIRIVFHPYAGSSSWKCRLSDKVRLAPLFVSRL